ncbi:extracellular solute-binding protein [Patescibacteria group bacterium]|nr:extracellular solute-binding protein [Patescibacteria group bacterium]
MEQKFNFSKPQIIVISIISLIAFIFIGIFTGVLPGGREKKVAPPQMDLVIWGVVDEASAFNASLIAYSKLQPNIRVTYKKIEEASYEHELINALAAGKGPDIFMVDNSWLPKHSDKMAPMSAEKLSFTQLRSLFPETVEKDFVWKDSIFALPLYIDSLALFYNQDIFDNYAIAVPPSDWLEFKNLIPKLRKIDTNGNITRAAAAIGGSEKTIHNAADILSLLMLQAGAEMTTENFTSASFISSIKGGEPGLQSLDFYTKFADPNDLYYTWNESMPYSLDSFAQGKTAMIFEYASQKEILKTKNPFLKIKISPMPQPKTNEQTAINYAKYQGLAVSKYAVYPEWIWDLVIYLTTDKEVAENYLKNTNHPPALRTLIQKYSDDPEMGVFAKQALTAKSWLKPDEDKTRLIFSQMIEAVVSKQLENYDALSQAERAVSDLIKQVREEQF